MLWAILYPQNKNVAHANETLMNVENFLVDWDRED